MQSKRNVYLKMKTLEEARKIVHESFAVSDVLEIETIPVPEAVGRVLAQPVQARISSPHSNAAAMDGYAFKAQDLRKAGTELEVIGEVAAGDAPDIVSLTLEYDNNVMANVILSWLDPISDRSSRTSIRVTSSPFS